MRSIDVEVEVTFTRDDREDTYKVTATYTPGTPAYFDKGFGNWLPGDDPEIEDIELEPQDGAAPANFDDLPKWEQDMVEEAIVLGVREDDD